MGNIGVIWFHSYILLQLICHFIENHASLNVCDVDGHRPIDYLKDDKALLTTLLKEHAYYCNDEDDTLLRELVNVGNSAVIQRLFTEWVTHVI